MKQECKKCKARDKRDNLSSCLLECRQAYLTSENCAVVPYNETCPFPQTEKELEFFQRMDESEKYLFRNGHLPCPLCSGKGCKECSGKGGIQDYKDTRNEYERMYMLAKEVRKLKNAFSNAFSAIEVSGYRDGVEDAFEQLEVLLKVTGNKIENKDDWELPYHIDINKEKKIIYMRKSFPHEEKMK